MASIPDMGIYGDNVTVRLFIDGQPQDGLQYSTSIKIKEDATIHKRNHLGRKRQRVGKQIDGYTINLAMDLAKTTLLKRLKERDTARDNNQPVPDLTIGFKFTLRNGSEVQYVATGCEAVPDIDAGDRQQEVGFNLEITCEDCDEVS